MNKNAKRFLRGLIYVVIGLLVIFNMHGLEESYKDYLVDNGHTYKEAVDISYNVFGFGSLVICAIFFYGVFLIFWGRALDSTMFTGSGTGVIPENERGKYDGFGNISTVLKYRDAKMGTMGNKESASLFAETAWVDGMISQSGSQKNTSDSISYLNAKLGTMGNEEALTWLKSGAK